MEDDYKKLDDLIKGPIESNTTSLIKVKDIKNIKLREQLKMSLDFLRFYKKHLHQLVHSSSDRINLYLLPKNLFQSDIKYAEYIFTLGDIIKTKEQEKKQEDINKDKTEEKQEGEKEKNNMKRDENFSIYEKKKDIKIDEALEILFGEKSVESSYLKEIDIDLLKEKKKELNLNLGIFQNYYDSFIQIAPDIKRENFEITETIKKNESDLFEKLNNYGNLLSKVLNNEITKVEALNIIDSIKKLVNDEVEDGKLLFEKVLEKIDNINISRIIDSKINRMKLIAYFMKKQSDKFYNYQQALYKEYKDSCNKIIKRAELIKETIKYITQEKEDILEKWKKISPPFNERYLKFDVITDDLKALISSMKIDINYSFNEKFVLWAIKDNYLDYLKY